MYFKETQVKSLVLRLRDRFPGAELVFDAYSPFLYRSHNLRVTRKKVGVHLHWALKHSHDLEGWGAASSTGAASSSGTASSPGAGIRLLAERYPFQYPEPRIRNALQVRLVYPLIAKGLGVFHYHL
jgi:O-methyltransferase involved in polyketide biosynthesis